MTMVPVCTFSVGGGGLNLLPNFQKGGAWEDFNFERGVVGKEGVTFFRGEGLQFYKKRKKRNLKYLMTKKVYKQKYFSLS